MYFNRTIRGIELEIFAEDFDGDPSIGIPYTAQHIYAIDEDGQDFQLTNNEVEQISIEATKAYYED